MTHYSPAELAAQLKTGLLSFPVTHFTVDLAFDQPAYREHLAWLSRYDLAGLFAAGGTGEGFSLTQPGLFQGRCRRHRDDDPDLRPESATG